MKSVRKWLQGKYKSVPDDAIDAYRNIRREDSAEQYVKAQLALAIALDQQGDTEGALTAYRNIRREDSEEAYLLAQLILGEQGDIDGVIAAYRNIRREDSPEQYAKAQLILGVALGQQGDIDGEIEAYRNIRREDSPEQYAEAQLYLGITLGQKGDIAGEIEAYRNICREDSKEQYAKAQVNLGVTLRQQGDIDGAIEAYRNVRREDSPEQYAKAQLILGVTLGKQGDIDGEIAAYRNIRREDSPEKYAEAQLYLGITLGQKGDITGKIEAYRNVRREDSKEQYAKAQVNLGVTLGKQGDIDGEIAAYCNIRREDSPEKYAEAQLYLGITLGQKANTDGALEAYRNIRREDSPEQYAKAQLALGMILSEQDDIDDKISVKGNINGKYFESASLDQINKCQMEYRESLSIIRKYILRSMEDLIVFSTKKIRFELKVSHYTKGSTAWVMIGSDGQSAFRLNFLKNVNDPMEGLVLNQYLQKTCQFVNGILDSKVTKDTENSIGTAFVSCFTFNHDSLNQFRLYGKESAREASGVSLVFSEGFFDSFDPDSSSVCNSIESENKDSRVEEEYSKNNENLSDSKLLSKQILYRCIYIDPDSGYLSLARRDHITFYRELLAEYSRNNLDGLFNLDELSKKAQEKWGQYQQKISEAEKNIWEAFKIISKQLQNLKEIIDRKVASQEEIVKVYETLNFLLLPIQYLVKHAAFQEEQECRIVYITDISNEKIKMDWDGKQMYIEYQPSVKENIDKIYLSPGAKAHEDFFRRVLNDTGKKKKVRISANPFRHK